MLPQRIASSLNTVGSLCQKLSNKPHLLANARSMASGLSATVIPGRGPNFRPTRAPLILTQAAVDRVKTALAESGGSAKALRIGVRTRGCNGLSYTLEYASEKGAMDETVEQDGVIIYIDRKAQLTLLGTEMDYVKGALVSEFVFYNPNAKGTCGCGESFNV